MADTRSSTAHPAARYGRWAGAGLFAAIMTTFTGVCTWQLVDQLWPATESRSGLDCQEGLRRLLHAVRTARTAAASTHGGEQVALERFRSALEPAWRDAPALERACQGGRPEAAAYGALVRLRFAEEHAVRYESADLARQRRQMRQLERTLLVPGR